MILNDVLKREVIEGDKVKEAQSKIKKISNKIEREKSKKTVTVDGEVAQLEGAEIKNQAA